MDKKHEAVFDEELDDFLAESLSNEEDKALSYGAVPDLIQHVRKLAVQLKERGPSSFSQSQLAFLLLFAGEVLDDTIASEKVHDAAQEELNNINGTKLN